jgi:hypothetical protein
MPEFKIIAVQEGWLFGPDHLGRARVYIRLSHDEVTMITTAANPVAAFCGLIPDPSGIAIALSLGAQTTSALLSILNTYHGKNGIVISFPAPGTGGVPVPLLHGPAIWDELG